MRYVAYSKLYRKGQPVGRKYKATGEFKTARAARAAATRSNREWNKQSKDMKARCIEVKRVGKKRISRSRSRSRAFFDIGFGI